MSAPYRTLVDIRADIQTRLGFGMSGQAGVVNSPLIDSMIKSAQNQLYEQHDWLELKAVHERSTGENQIYYDYPLDCNIERISNFSVKFGDRYLPLKEGIDVLQRNNTANGEPLRYELRDQIEIWPVPSSANFTLRFEYIKTLAPLVANTDRVSLPNDLIFLHALSNAKSHYGQKDAQIYASQLDTLLTKVKQRQRRTVFESARAIDPYSYVTSSQMVG